MEIIELIDLFRNKAGCSYTEEKAFSILEKLKNLLNKEDYNKLSLGFSHFRIGEGASELYSACKELKEKYLPLTIPTNE